MRLILVAVLAVAVGCRASNRPDGDMFPAELEAAELGWVQAGLPEVSAGDLRVEWAVTPLDFERRCRARVVWCKRPGSAAACLVRWRDRRKSGWLVLMSPGQPLEEDGEPIIHEVMHALFAEAQLGAALDPYDESHVDPRVWYWYSPESAQARAHVIYIEAME